MGLGTSGTQPAGRKHSLGSENWGLRVLCSFWPKVFFPNDVFFKGDLQPVANLSHIQCAV